MRPLCPRHVHRASRIKSSPGPSGFFRGRKKRGGRERERERERPGRRGQKAGEERGKKKERKEREGSNAQWRDRDINKAGRLGCFIPSWGSPTVKNKIKTYRLSS